jgi:hypothetical protein
MGYINNFIKIKYEKPLRKEGKKHARLTYQAQSLPLQREFGH